LPADVPQARIAVQFIEALRSAVVDHDADCEPSEAVRLRVALDNGELRQGDPGWDDQQAIAARDLVGSPVLRRVVAAETRNPLALIASAEWYDSCFGPGPAPADGYREVWVSAGRYRGSAWVRVPGRTRPQGLLPEDDPPARPIGHAPATRAADDVSGTHPEAGVDLTGNRGNVVQGGQHGTVIQGGVINGDINIGNDYAANYRERDGGR
jgi:hypothetical protein